MLSRHFHSLALALAVSTLALILSGAAQLGKAVGEPHRGLSGLVAALTFLCLIASFGQPQRWLKMVAGAGLLAVFALGGLGFVAETWAVLLHACLAHLFFAATVVLAVATSAAWNRPPLMMEDTGSPSLRTLGRAVPVAVFLQIFLGAIFRHADAPVWPHILGSLLVGGLLLYTGMVVLESHGNHPILKLVAQVLLGVTIFQIALGLGAFLGRVMAGDGLSPEGWMVAARTLHVATGALTLGSAVAYGMLVFHHVHPGSEPHRIGKSVVA